MKIAYSKLFAAFALSGSALCHAQSLPPNSPYFAKIADTVFVSGSGARWYGALTQAVPNSRDETFAKLWLGDPQRRVRRVVFVNAMGEGIGNTAGLRYGGERQLGFIKERFERYGIETVVIGRCDHYCMALFQFGVQRFAGHDIGGSITHFDLQPLMDFDTQQLDLRFPSVEFAKFEFGPLNTKIWKTAALQALSQVKDSSGGLHIPLEGKAEFCASRQTPSSCTSFEQINAVSTGLLTNQELLKIELPPHMPASERDSGFAPLKDNSPFQSDAAKSAHQSFLGERLPRYLAANESLTVAKMSVGNPARSIESCEKESGQSCRLYAVDNLVVWTSKPN